MPATSRHALLLSGSLGAGHDTSARALATALDDEGWSSTTLDSMALLGGRSGAVGEEVFRRLLARPGLYDGFHFAVLRSGTRVARWADGAARRPMVPRLAAALAGEAPDVVIAVFATGASAAAELARAGNAPPVVAFCPDVTPHRLWVHEGIGAYLVICDAAEAAVRRFQPQADVRVIPRPVRAEFMGAPPKSPARDALGLPSDAACVLIMAGGWGIEALAEASEAMAAAGCHVLAVAGRNRTLRSRLEILAASVPRVHPFGFTDQIPLLMSACDLVITTSGVTCSEARAMGRELVVIDATPGHGRENLQHELEVGHAAVASTEAPLLTATALAALEKATDRPRRDPMPGFVEGLDDVLGDLGLSAARMSGTGSSPSAA